MLGGQVYGSSVNPPVRHKCLAAISKLVHFSTPERLRSLLHESNISRYVWCKSRWTQTLDEIRVFSKWEVGRAENHNDE